MTGTPSRRAVLQALGALPVLMAAGRAGAAADDAADPVPPLSAAQRLTGFATAQAETFAAPLTTLSGRLPPALAGVLWRNGPAEHERFGHRYGHWFDGDGMVQAFTFSGAGVSHRARILETPKRRRETEAGKRLLPAFATLPPETVPILSPDDMNTANTSVLAHGGRLMALWEGGSALAFDPETLAAGDFVSWRADLAGAPFSAHPKVEADGTCWNIGCVTAPQPMLLFYRIDPDGRLAAFNALPEEPLGMVHDYVVTRRHLVLVLSPFVVEQERFAAGPISFLDAHVWQPALGTRVIVVEKDSLTPVRRYALPPGFHFHHGNGWEEADGTIHLDLCQAADPMFAIHDLRAVMEGDWSFPSAHPRYRRMVLRPGGAAAVEQVATRVADFPRIDPRRTGLRHRALFALTGSRRRRLAALADRPDRSRSGRCRRLVLPAPPDPGGARVRAARGGGRRRLAGGSLPRSGAARRRAQRLRRPAPRRRPALAGHPALPATPRPARDLRGGVTRELGNRRNVRDEATGP